MEDDWGENVESIKNFITKNFQERNIGLMCDFAKEINKVYTAVFPSKNVIQQILKDDITDAMLFIHHAATWDIRKKPVFQTIESKLLDKLQERKISIYNLHVPLDNYGDYSTSVNLAKALGIKPIKPFAPYFGSLAGVFGESEITTVKALKKKYQEMVGHKVSLYSYGEDKIKNLRVAVIAGGGLNEALDEVIAEGCNVFITGITAQNDYSKGSHDLAQNARINILGGTHYSSEMFSCIEMMKYFENLGIESEFIKDQPILEDL